MTLEEAIKYCKYTECEDCMKLYPNDIRNKYEKEFLHYPCLIRLLHEEERKSCFPDISGNIDLIKYFNSNITE